MKLSINIQGCDDSTHIEVDATPEQYKELRALAALSRRNGGGCQPTIEIREVGGR